MEVVSKFIGMVKTNTKGFCKETIEKITKDWPGGSHIMLSSEPMGPGGSPLVAIRYNYNVRKVISVIVT